ncbi:MAG: hypothetical protein V3U67_10510 [Gemmatimonadota bacterium]
MRRGRRVGIAVVAIAAIVCLPAGVSAQQQPVRNPADYAPAYELSSGKAAKKKRELGIIAEPLGTIDPCTRPAGPNFINFVSRGRTVGEATYMYGIDLCTLRPFVYQEPTRPGVIAGFDANPPRIRWASDPADSRNLRGDRFGFELLVGMEGVFTTAHVDFGLSADRNPDASLAPYVGVRFSRIRLTYSRAAFPTRRTWLTKVGVMPFRQGPRGRGPRPGLPQGNPGGETEYFEPVSNLCNAANMGIRGVDEFRVGEKQDDGFPVTLNMVSYCGPKYAAYSVRTRTGRAYFSQFNNTFPQFANWGDIPRGGLLNNLALVGGYGQVEHDLGASSIETKVVYLGIGISFGNSRWRFDGGRLFPLESFEVGNELDPIRIEVTGWTAGFQRALSL